ncbi:MAG TPA: hypothetical protein VFG01_04850, partial [Acidobacteriota bacterium]|nr:hypothetical protein [Acidobacteriota bacterium]
SFIYILFIKNMIVTSIPAIVFILCIHILPYRRADVKFRYDLCSVQIFNAILRGRARDEASTMRAERAWFLFRGERSPNGREIPRW